MPAPSNPDPAAFDTVQNALEADDFTELFGADSDPLPKLAVKLSFTDRLTLRKLLNPHTPAAHKDAMQQVFHQVTIAYPTAQQKLVKILIHYAHPFIEILRFHNALTYHSDAFGPEIFQAIITTCKQMSRHTVKIMCPTGKNRTAKMRVSDPACLADTNGCVNVPQYESS